MIALKRPFFLMVIVSAMWLWVCYGSPAMGQVQKPAPATPPATEQADPPEQDQGPRKTDKIDQTGEKVSKGLDAIGKKASRRVGGWINIKVFAGISLLKLILCMVLIFFVLLVQRVVKHLIHKKREAIETVEGKMSLPRVLLKAIVRPLSLFIWVYGFYAALSPLYAHLRAADGTNLVHTVAQKIADIGGTVALFWFLYELVAIIDARLVQWAQGTESTIDDILTPLVGKTLRVFIIVIGGIIVIQNLTGLKIGPLLASLGIGGLAVALAAKDTIANFFGTLTILFDKPFQVGERILIDQYDGVVEKVGFRSTRIRTLTGHLVTIPNEKVVNSGLENIAKRPHIRWLTNIGITYDTEPDMVEKAVEIIKEIIDNHEGMHPDFPPRVVFNGFNDWSLNIFVIIWYHPPDYWNFQAWLERTCLAIMRRFQDEGIDFAFPSRTLYLANDEKRQIKLELLKNSEQLAQAMD